MSYKRVLEGLSERQDVVLGAFIVSVIFMLILPLPTGLVDALIALNMGLSVILLMVAVYLTTPLEFSAFPAVLLITTLFRLGLSISTTRLILLQGDAGRIVDAFGNFVVGGNLAVGLVVFLILTIVQFVVITKGAERVAEVGARFSLDALPGKQLSIDADVRAGSLTLEEARALRGKVQQESKLYGAMDGAMKFVKGDAIASLIIVFVNLLGGLAIGMLQRGLSFGDAVERYSILSIGDGLVAQIPALFISITAGILVTRVGEEGRPGNLGRDIGGQIGRQPRALLISAVMLLAMGFVPGFPLLVFGVLSGLVGFPALMAVLASRRVKETTWDDAGTGESASAEPEAVGKGGFMASRDPVFAPTTPILVELPLEGRELGSLERAREEVNQARVNLYYRLGAPLPVMELKVSAGAPSGRYRIFVGEIPASEGKLELGKVFVLDREDGLEAFGIPYEKGEDFLPEARTLWVEEGRGVDLDSAGLRWCGLLELVRRHCELTLSHYAADFMGVQETKFLLTRMEGDFPDLVKEAQHALPVHGLADVLRRLVQEQVSIRDLRQILSAVVEWGGREKDPVMLVEHVRGSLSRQISYQHAVGGNVLPAYLLDSEMEETIRNGIRQTSTASYIVLEPEMTKKIVERVRLTMGEEALRGDHVPALVVAMDIRRYVRRLLEADMPSTPVLSYQEVSSEVALQPVGRVVF